MSKGYIKGIYMKKLLKDYIICTMGAFMFVCGINFIIAPLGLYNGGFVGIGQLVRYVLETFMHIHIKSFDIAGLAYFLLNAPLFILAYKSMSKHFFCKTIYTVVLQTLLLSVVPIPEVSFTNNTLTACIIGGLASGVGVGIILQAGSSGGGQDILGIYCSKKYPGFSVGKITLLVNIFVYGCCAVLFDVEIVVYSLIYTYIMSMIIDKIHTQNINNTVMIFTKKAGLEDYLIERTGRGVTMWKGWGGYTKEPLEIAMMALSKYEIQKLKKHLFEFDKNAFIIVNNDIPIYGNFEKHLES